MEPTGAGCGVAVGMEAPRGAVTGSLADVGAAVVVRREVRAGKASMGWSPMEWGGVREARELQGPNRRPPAVGRRNDVLAVVYAQSLAQTRSPPSQRLVPHLASGGRADCGAESAVPRVIPCAEGVSSPKCASQSSNSLCPSLERGGRDRVSGWSRAQSASNDGRMRSLASQSGRTSGALPFVSPVGGGRNRRQRRRRRPSRHLLPPSHPPPSPLR